MKFCKYLRSTVNIHSLDGKLFNLTIENAPNEVVSANEKVHSNNGRVFICNHYVLGLIV